MDIKGVMNYTRGQFYVFPEGAVDPIVAKRNAKVQSLKN